MKQFHCMLLYLCVMIPKEEAEFQTWNIALRKPAIQSSVTLRGTADRAVDGNSTSDFYGGSCIHTLHGEVDQWWMVDLQGVYNITDVWIRNRGDMHGYKFHDFVVEVYMRNPVSCLNGKHICNSHAGPADLGENVHLPCKETIGRYVKILKRPEFITDIHNDVLIICEVQIKGNLVKLFSRDDIYMKHRGRRFPANSQIRVGISTVKCAVRCTSDNSCSGINVRPSDGGCQLASNLSSNLSQAVDRNWNYYTRC